MRRLPRIPDLLTTANLCCGTASILLASQGELTAACWLVFAGAAFDVLDGLAARALGGGSGLGEQLDSLADLVTFGVAPAFAVFLVSEELLARTDVWLLMAGCSVLVVASMWRLAIFNTDDRQRTGFLGVPTPANGLTWASLVLIQIGTPVQHGPGTTVLRAVVTGLFTSEAALFAASMAMAVLMLSSIPLPSLKFKHFAWRGNEVVILLLAIGAALLAVYGILAVPMILLLYLLSPFWGKLFPKTT
ncbi:MAG: CDP-alcohol phosphatidyltransferase family protein [Flavobacteriales bacterium]|nr:CDP-alcohol phosphatidyltransferase family protein [Flavobacteriales bacterium]